MTRFAQVSQSLSISSTLARKPFHIRNLGYVTQDRQVVGVNHRVVTARRVGPTWEVPAVEMIDGLRVVVVEIALKRVDR